MIITSGKTNPEKNIPCDIRNLDGTTDTITLRYKSIHVQLETIAPLLVKAYNEGLTENEYIAIAQTLYVVTHKSRKNNASKLDGLKSLSTSCLCNRFCTARMNNPASICRHCYSATQQSRQAGLRDHNILNGVILRNVLIPSNIFRLVFNLYNDKFFRVESFGDVENVTQARNYIHIMQSFPECTFAVWTKNPYVWKKAFDIEGKPTNCVFVLSSNYVNEVAFIPKELAPYVDHVFTVYDKTAAQTVNINCGGRRCMDCIRAGKGCYYKGTEFYIRELIK